MKKIQDKYGTINSIRQLIIEELRDYEGKPIKLNLDGISGLDGLESLIFREYVNEGKSLRIIAFSNDILRKIDLSSVSFDGVSVAKYDFTGLTGVKINPETVYEKDLSHCKFDGVEFIGNFDNCTIYGSDFTGSKGAVIDPYRKKMNDCKFSGVTFLDNWIDTDVSGCDFTGSNVLMTAPRNINMNGAKLNGVRFAWKVQDSKINGCDFSGSRGAIIFPNEWTNKSAIGTNFEGVTFSDGWFDGWNLRGASFKGSTGALIDLDMILNKDVSDADLTDAYFGPVKDDIIMTNTVCNGMGLEEYLMSTERKDSVYVKVKSILDESKK